MHSSRGFYAKFHEEVASVAAPSNDCGGGRTERVDSQSKKARSSMTMIKPMIASQKARTNVRLARPATLGGMREPK